MYLANNDPEQNVELIKEFDKVKFSMCDTIDFWIQNKRDSVIKMIKAVDAVVINDEEAKLLTKEFKPDKVCKKDDEVGSKLCYHQKRRARGNDVLRRRGFSNLGFLSGGCGRTPQVAGDSFAGGMIGYLASQNSTSMSQIKKAVVYGNVMGSFAVEGYGLDGLTAIRKIRHFKENQNLSKDDPVLKKI